MRADLERITLAGRTPHGYTLAMWAAGMFCIKCHGLPGTVAILAFTVAATATFGLVRYVSSVLPRPAATPSPGARLGGSVHLLALPGSVLTGWLVAQLPAPWCWPAMASATTVVFVLLHACQDVLERRLRIFVRPRRSAKRRRPTADR